MISTSYGGFESLKWREKWEVDKLQDWEPPEVMQKYYPSGISGFDKDGAPVIVVPFAGLDMWGMMHSVTKTDFMKMTIKTLEKYLKVALDQGNKFGPDASQMYEANYPEILKACYIINAPKVFSIAFSVVKNFLNEYTLRKIQIIKSDPNKWKPVLQSMIECDQMPAHYGGSLKDPDGNPKYTTKVHQGGKVPKSYYFKKTEKGGPPGNENFTTVTVKKGEKLTLPLIAPAEQYILKVNSHQTDEIGVLTCPAPATYNVIFDNSYSYLRNKKLHYSIAIVPPLTVKEDEEIALQDG
ncbi:hypothetical protein C0J52_23433 [Blattella germanica]|nr:hypothetical protein C0J52_23433 [Blattella germanica]